MAKLSRSVLKEIVKECIVEIFEESFFRPDSSMINESANKVTNRSTSQKIYKSKRPRQNTQQHTVRKNSYLDNVTFGKTNNNQNIRVNENFDRKVNMLTSKVTNDPVMSEIFKDTAATTLQNQTSADSKRGGVSVMVNGDAAAKAVSQSDPTELFAESAGKWATLAFADSIKK